MTFLSAQATQSRLIRSPRSSGLTNFRIPSRLGEKPHLGHNPAALELTAQADVIEPWQLHLPQV